MKGFSSGTSLIELIIGLFLIHILVLSGYGMYQLALETWQVSVTRLDEESLLRHALASLSQDLWEAKAASLQVQQEKFCFETGTRYVCYQEKEGNIFRVTEGEKKKVLEQASFGKILAGNTLKIELLWKGEKIVYVLRMRN